MNIDAIYNFLWRELLDRNILDIERGDTTFSNEEWRGVS